MTRTVDHEAEKVTLRRRDFIAGGVAMAGAMIVPRHVLGGSGQAAPSDKLNIAVIGAGGRGADDTEEEWIESCKGNGETESNFLFAGPLTEALLLGNIALRFGGRELHWDAEKMKITNIAEANQFLQVRYRQGWTL